MAEMPRATGLLPIMAGGKCVAVAELDLADACHFSQWNWQLTRGYATRTQSLGKRGAKKTVWLHREIAATPDGLLTDHINGVRLDNRRANLRWASASQNVVNRSSKAGTSKYRGVCRHSNGKVWMARVQFGRKVRYLGIFSTEEEAAIAYDQAARELHGKFALLNF